MKRASGILAWALPALVFGVLGAISPIATPLVWAAAGLLAALGLVGLRLLGFRRPAPARKRGTAKPRGKKAGSAKRKPPARAPARPVRKRRN